MNQLAIKWKERGTSDQAISILFHWSIDPYAEEWYLVGLSSWGLWSINFKLSLLLLIALLLAIRIDHTSERKSAILLNIMAEIPETDIYYHLSRHKNRIRIDMPERHDTGSHTLREKGKTLVSSGGPSR